MEIDYKYGLEGPMMRYLGPVIFPLLGAVFFAMALGLPFTDLPEEMPFHSAVCFPIFVFMVPVMIRCTRLVWVYGDQFLLEYGLNSDGIIIERKGKAVAFIPSVEVTGATTIRLMKILEVRTSHPGWERIVFVPNTMATNTTYAPDFDQVISWFDLVVGVSKKWW